MIDIFINVYTVERLLNCQAFASDSVKETLSNIKLYCRRLKNF